ncbi:hypothetical protein ACFQH2_15420 [Natronoarchaeum sp. GCM10025703]|uniref:hypothetical protein n=1 Tax=unclassified Natronoarchaeum TaxID=2620183 RepID=UPI00361FD084
MVVRASPCDGDDPVSLPGAVPYDFSHLSRQSWELGSRTVDDDESTLLCRWEQASRRWVMSIFEVTSTTVIIRVETPVGRERFYGAIRSELESAIPRLEAAPDWRRSN